MDVAIVHYDHKISLMKAQKRGLRGQYQAKNHHRYSAPKQVEKHEDIKNQIASMMNQASVREEKRKEEEEEEDKR